VHQHARRLPVRARIGQALQAGLRRRRRQSGGHRGVARIGEAGQVDEGVEFPRSNVMTTTARETHASPASAALSHPLANMNAQPGLKGPGIFLAQFTSDEEPFNNWRSLTKWAGSLGYVGVQIPTWDARCIDLKMAAESTTYCDELKGVANE